MKWPAVEYGQHGREEKDSHREAWDVLLSWIAADTVRGYDNGSTKALLEIHLDDRYNIRRHASSHADEGIAGQRSGGEGKTRGRGADACRAESATESAESLVTIDDIGNQTSPALEKCLADMRKLELGNAEC